MWVFILCITYYIQLIFINGSVIETNELPGNRNFMASIGNGYMASVVMSDSIHVAGVYNGRANVIPAPLHKSFKENLRNKVNRNDWISSHTHRANIPATSSINFTINYPSNRKYSLDMYNGVFVQDVLGENFHVRQQTFAHRKLKHVFVNRFIINTDVDIQINFYTKQWNSSDDFYYQVIEKENFNIFKGETKESEYEGVSKAHVTMISTKVPENIIVKKTKVTKELYFLTIITTNWDSVSPYSMWEKVNSMLTDLYKTHTESWHEIWSNGSIQIKGDLTFQQSTEASLYNLYSSICHICTHGISPGGLPISHEYLGHVFWDQEIWMLPSILTFFPDIAKGLLQYRIDRLQAAREHALKYNLKGAMFPWESAVSGSEVCPEEVYGRNEIHITGDIVFAMRQYFYATKDFDWLENEAFPVIYETTLFWESRISYNKTRKLYLINDVMPPDEYQYPVNNSAYTNVLCKIVFEFAIEAANILGKNVPDKWRNISGNIFIPYNYTLDYHPEYEGFDVTDNRTLVKQADVILINYPLMYKMNTQTKINDLKYYEAVTDVNGPAMTFSMFTIGWLDLLSYEKAYNSFRKNFQNIQKPFYIWSEIKDGGGASNFLTGVGGYLQSIINGYFGIRIKSNELIFQMTSLPNTTSVSLNGLKYLKNTLKFTISNTSCEVMLTQASGKHSLEIHSSSQHIEMELLKPYPICKGSIFSRINNYK